MYNSKISKAYRNIAAHLNIESKDKFTDFRDTQYEEMNKFAATGIFEIYEAEGDTYKFLVIDEQPFSVESTRNGIHNYDINEVYNIVKQAANPKFEEITFEDLQSKAKEQHEMNKAINRAFEEGMQKDWNA